jgi:hypothetical protein
MGTRLYPNTRDRIVLEQLAQVPTGTMMRLNALKARKITTRKGVDYYLVPGVPQLMPVRDFGEIEKVWEAEFEAIYEEKNCYRLDGFLSEGWGKILGVFERTARELGMIDETGYISAVGSLNDTVQVAKLLDELDRKNFSVSLSDSEQILVIPHPTDIYAEPTRIPIAALGGVHWA